LQLPGTPSQQIEATGGQSLGTETSGNAMHGFDVQIQAVAGEFSACQVEGTSQDGLTGDGAEQGGAVGAVEAECSQFGVEANAGRATAVARARARAAVKSSNPEDQAAQQANAARTSLALAQGPSGLV